MKLLNSPKLWGIGGLVLAIVIGVTAAALYVSPLGSRSLIFYTDDAGTIRPGMTVRVAGITVGKIEDLALEPDQVRVRAVIDGNVFVGDQSAVQVRMLTVVGGYYVNLDTFGNSPLGKNAIPKARVTLPYSLVEVLNDAPKITDGIDTKPIHESLEEIQRGLSGDNVQSITAIIQAGQGLTDMLDRQRGQLSQILDISDEYIRSFANYRGELRKMLEKVSIIEQTMIIYGKGFTAAIAGLGEIGKRLMPVAEFVSNHRDKLIEKIINWQQTARAWADRAGLVARILQRVRGRMENTLEIKNAPPELLATDLCVPMPANPC